MMGKVCRPFARYFIALLLACAPVLWAQHSGMFAKAGLTVDIQKFTAGSAVTAAVVGGALDVGSPSPIFNTFRRNSR